MRKLAMCCAVLALAVGCDEEAPADTDSGTTPVDGGGGGADSGGGTEDAGGGGDDAGGGGDDAGGDTDGGMTVTLDCATYCGRIMTACTAGNAQYASMDNCMDTCAAFPEGAISDTGGNTLGCRIYHAGAAADDADMHCSHAGPLGDGACGGDCESFCTIAVDLCPAAYASMGMCMGACDGYTPGDYSTASTSGDTLACRMYHLTAASTDPVPHCTHIGSTSPTCN
jgi:hypothetical protein